MGKNLTSLLLACFFLHSGAALATPPPTIATDAETKDQRTEVNVGFLIGGGEVGPDRRVTRGLHINVGKSFGNVAALAEYSYLSIGNRGASQGFMSRLGVVARYSLLRTGAYRDRPHSRPPLAGNFWFEGGVGVQRIVWNEGGTLTRPDIVAGFGWQLNGVIGRKSDKPRYYGPYVAFRASVSRAPEHGMDVEPTCSGPCDTATRPSRNNVGLFIHFGVNWAR